MDTSKPRPAATSPSRVDGNSPASNLSAWGETPLTARHTSVKDIVLARDREVSPFGPHAESWARRYAREAGILDHIDERRFDAYNSIARYVYSYASLDRLIAASSWLGFLFFIDDQFDENRELGRDKARVRRLIVALLELLESGTPIADQPVLTRITIDLRESFARLASPAWFEQLCGSTEDYLLRGVADGVRAWRQRTHRTVDSYMSTRDSDSGMYTCIDIIELAAGIDLPQHVRDDKRIQRLRRLCARHVAFTNDMMSYDKEMRCHSNPSNLLHLLMTRDGLSFEQAAVETVAVINRDMQEFQRIESDLPDMGEARDDVIAYVNGMHRWMRGNIDWSLASLRYCTPANPFPELRAGYERAVAHPTTNS